MRRPSTAELMLLVTVVLWAFNFTVTKYVLTHGFQPLAYAAIRYSGAALVFAGITYGLERTLRVGRRDLAVLLGVAVVALLLNQVTFVYAIELTTASTVALVMGTLPIFTALIASAFGLERLRARFMIAGAISFAGVALVALGASGGVSGDVRGILLALVTAVTWAAYSVAIAPLMRRYSAYRISAIVLLAASVPLLVAGAPQLSRQDFGLAWLTWAALVFALLGPLVLTNVLWFKAIDRVGPSRATIVTNLQPFLAAIFALVLLSEQMTWLQVAGGLAIGAGIVLARRRAPVLVAE